MYFDFRCDDCGTRFDTLVKPDVFETPCKQCDGTAKRQISKPRVQLPGNDPDFPGAWALWEKKNRRKRAQDKKHYDNHGVDPSHGGDVKR
jgi:putative FmdB family regulatory protein